MNHESVLKRGDTILDGRYRVEALIGEGEFTEVYHVYHLGVEADRALKITKRGTPGVTKAVLEQYRDRFRLEVQLGSKLNKQDDPHVLAVYDFGEMEGRPYLDMEYAPGGDLQSKIEEGPLEVVDATRIAMMVAEGLETLHGLGAIHRNLKPTNILFDAHGNAKIADWGLAQVPRRRSIREDTEGRGPVHPGTPEYMSPEQALTTTYLTPSSDVYSLGCVLFEMLTGRLWQEAMVTVDSVRELRPEVPPSLEGVLWKMLRKRPGQRKEDARDSNKRYVTMDGVQVGLAGVLFDEALDAADLGHWTQAERLLEDILLRYPDYGRDGRKASIVQANIRRHIEREAIQEPVPQRYLDESGPMAPPPPIPVRPPTDESPSPASEVVAEEPRHRVSVTATQEMELPPADVLSNSDGQYTMPLEPFDEPEELQEPEKPAPVEKKEPVKLSLAGRLRLVGLILLFVWLCVVTLPTVSLYAFNSLQDDWQVVLLPGLFGEELTPTATPTMLLPTSTLTPTHTHTPAPTKTPTLTATPTPVEIGMVPTATLTTSVTSTITGTAAVITEPVKSGGVTTTTTVITTTSGLTDTERLIQTKTVLNTEDLTGTVSTGVLWVRQGPSPDFRAVAKQEEGDVVNLLGRNEDTSWLRIKMANEEEGWVDARFIDTQAPVDMLTPVEAPPIPTSEPEPTQPATDVPEPAPEESPTSEATSEPEMKYPAPVVIGPPDGTVWTDGETAHHYLEWESLNLAPDEFYNVTFIYERNGEVQYFGTATVESPYLLPAPIHQLQPDRGEYSWRVVVRQNTSEQRGKRDGPAVSPESDMHSFTWR